MRCGMLNINPASTVNDVIIFPAIPGQNDHGIVSTSCDDVLISIFSATVTAICKYVNTYKKFRSDFVLQ